MLRWTRAISLLIPRLIKDYGFGIRKYSKHPESADISIRYKKLSKLVRIVSKRLGVVFDVTGLEKLPKDQKFMIVSNHLSSFDALAMLCILDEPTSFVAKIETEKFFAIGNAVKSIDGLFLDRKDLKQQLKVMMKVQEDLKQQNKNWIIYPEGTRREDELLLVGSFHHGTFRPAVKSNTPIVPIAIYGTNRVLKLKPQFRKYVVSISILDPIYPEQYKDLSTEEIAAQTRDSIQNELSYKLRLRNHKLMFKYNKKKYNYYKII